MEVYGGTTGRWGNPGKWGNPSVRIKALFIVIMFTSEVGYPTKAGYPVMSQ